MRTAPGRVYMGPAGTATEIVTTQEPGDDLRWSGSLSGWLLHCPGQAAGWSDYLLIVMHLRDMEGSTPVIRVPRATHEFFLTALDPAKSPQIDDPKSWSYLRPYNVEEQVELTGDVDAVVILQGCALAVVRGMLPAEPALSGDPEPWRTVLIQTAAHHRGEVHGNGIER